MPSSSVIAADCMWSLRNAFHAEARRRGEKLLGNRALFAQHLGARGFNGEEDLLVKMEGEVFVQRLGGATIDDIGDLRGVVRRERKAFAGVVDLAKSEQQLLAERLAKEAVGDVGFETLVIDIHRRN